MALRNTIPQNNNDLNLYYIPSTSGNWNPVPKFVAPALDQLASRVPGGVLSITSPNSTISVSNTSSTWHIDEATYGTAQTLYSPIVTTDAYGRTTMSNFTTGASSPFSSPTDLIYEDTNSNVASGSYVTATFNAGLTLSYFNQVLPTTNTFNKTTGIFTCSQKGLYSIFANTTWTSNTTGIRGIRLMWDPTGNAGEVGILAENSTSLVSLGVSNVSVNSTFYLANTDELYVNIYQNSGGNLDGQVFFSVVFLHE